MRRTIERRALIPGGFGSLVAVAIALTPGARAASEETLRPPRPKTVLLPDAGPHRASRVLRLAGILTGREDQVHLWWQVLKQEGEDIVNGRRPINRIGGNRISINHMVVIKHQNKLIRDVGDFIEQGC